LQKINKIGKSGKRQEKGTTNFKKGTREENNSLKGRGTANKQNVKKKRGGENLEHLIITSFQLPLLREKGQTKHGIREK